MAEFQELLDFPPAPKLAVDGKLDPRRRTQAELRGQALFFGKAQCAHLPPAAVLHRQLDAQPAARSDSTSRSMINGMMASRRRADQDVPAARHQGLAALPARRPAADARRHGRVLQRHS